MIAAVNARLDRAADDAKGVVLTGRPGIFSGGFDLNVIRGGDAAQARAQAVGGARLMMRLYGWPQPLVVAAPGHAIALGAFGLLTGDHRLGADGEFGIGLNEVAIGATLPPFAWLLAKQRLSKRYLTQATLTAKITTPGARAMPAFWTRSWRLTSCATSRSNEPRSWPSSTPRHMRA
jgi:enoyl-CoA hydratase